jgi:OST-HTH/LOTUS domain
MIRELAPDFNPKSYGCSKLSLLFTKNGQFEVRRDKKKQIYVRLLPLQGRSPEADEGPYWPEHPKLDDPDEIPF